MSLLESRQAQAAEAGGRIRSEPLAEPMAGRRYRSWMRMSDEEVVAAANAFVRENGVANRTQLWKADAGMADRIRKRGLWKRIGFPGGTEKADGTGGRRDCESGRPGRGGNGKSVEAKQKRGGSLTPYDVISEPGRHGAERLADGRTGYAEAPEHEEGRPASVEAACGPAASFTRDEAVFLAQSAIDEMGISTLEELGGLDPEMHAIVVETGAAGSLSFPKRPEGGERRDGNGGEAAERGADEAPPARSEPRGVAEEERMFKLILTEAFGLGTSNPAIGSHRETVQSLQAGLKRKLKGPAQQRLFKRCWGRMEAEGMITYNSNKTAASLDLSVRPDGGGGLSSALSSATGAQCAVSPEWRAMLSGGRGC